MRRFLFALLSGLILAAPLAAQEQEEDDPEAGNPPARIPMPPPNFRPPSPPPSFIPPSPPQMNEAPRRSSSRVDPIDDDPAEYRDERIGPVATAVQSGSATAEQLRPIISAASGVDLDEPFTGFQAGELDTNSALSLLEQLSGKPVLRQQSIPSIQITYTAANDMTRGEGLLLLESLLALNGIAVTELGDRFLKAVPVANVVGQAPPFWEGTTLGFIPSQRVYQKLFDFNFLNTDEALTLIQPLLSSGISPIAFTKNQMLLITDSLINLQRLEQILQKVDKPAPIGTEILFFQVKHIEVADLAQRLQGMTEGSLINRLGGNTSFDADERTNQLIVFTHPANKDLIEGLIGKLDVDVAPLTRTEIYNVKHAEATKVVELIDQVITGQKEAREEQEGSRTNVRRRPRQQQAPEVSESTNLQFSDFLTIVADERANTIVASGTNSDQRFLGDLIEKLDVLLPQVRIEVIITEVSLSEGDARGIDSFALSYNTSGGGGGPDGGKNWVLDPGSAFGINLGPITTGPAGFSFEAVLNAAKTKDNITVLSAPTIVTTHNQEASISVGQSIPVVSSVTSSTDNLNNATTNIQQQEVNIDLKVKPLIGSNGIIQMEVTQSVQNLAGTQAINDSLEPQPIIGTREATSFVSVRDGGLIILGGLQDVNRQETESKFPLLSMIPVLGDLLFTRRQETDQRRELLIFIRPVIIKDADAANLDAENNIDRSDATEPVREYLNTGRFGIDKKEEDDEPEDDEPVRRRGRGI